MAEHQQDESSTDTPGHLTHISMAWPHGLNGLTTSANHWKPLEPLHRQVAMLLPYPTIQKHSLPRLCCLPNHSQRHGLRTA
jgi:hypothetical protein